MIDARTAVLVTAAIASPWLLQAGAAAGVPIPVYITGGQRAALAAFPTSVASVPTRAQGTALADTATFVAKWNAINSVLLAANGAASISEYTNPLWNPTNFAKLSPSEATDFAQAFITAADAGMAASDEPYPASLADSDEYQGIKGLLATSSVWGADDSDATDFIAPIYALALKLDELGYLPSGKPFTPTVAGGLDAAGSAVESFLGNVAGKTAAAAGGLAVGALLSTPGLLLMAGVVVWKVLR